MQRRILSIAIIGLVLMLYAFLNSSYFYAEELEWADTKNIVNTELVAYTTFYPQNVFCVDRQLIVDQLLEHPWVKQVGINWQWPNRLIVNITERNPIAMIPVEGSYLFLDQEGVLLPPSLNLQMLTLPIITNADIEELERLRVIARVLSDMPEDLYELISEWNYEQQILITRQGTQIYLGDLRDLERKFVRLDLILNDLKRRGIVAQRIDLRILNSPVIVE